MGKSDHKGHEVKAVHEPNGNTSNYFNGSRSDGSYKADGKGHSHVVSDSNGKVTFERDHGRK